MVARPLTIVQMLPELESGGVERGTLELGKYLAQHGHRSIVISGGGRMVPQLEAEGSEHVSWDVGKKNPLTLRYISKLKTFLSNQKVDILQLRSRVPAWIGYMAWKSLPENIRPRLVTTFHGFYSVSRYSSIMAKGDKVIAISKAIKDHIENTYKVPEEKISLIYRGVDLEYFDPHVVSHERIEKISNRWGLSRDSEAIIMLPGRITRWKGHELFLKSLALIRDLKWKAICVGNPAENPSYYNHLVKLAKNLQLHSRVKFIGHCDDMPAAYSIADIVISASSAEAEAFGRVSVEAQAMGKPVIATAHGGSLETVLPDKTGWLVRPNDPQNLADTLRNVLNDSHLIQKFGENGIKWVHENFSTARMCEETILLFRDLLKQKAETCIPGRIFDKTVQIRGKSLTVVQLVPELESGGVEKVTLEMGKYLVQHGHRSIVISGGGRLVPQLELEGSKHVLWDIGKKNPLTLRYISKLRKYLTQQKVDILHLRSRMPAWIGYMAWKSLPEKSRPRLVTTFHGFYSVNRYSAIMTKGEKVIAISKAIENHIKTTYEIPEKKIVLIQEGIDLNYFDPDQVSQERITRMAEEWGISQKMTLIMLPGRITRLKGHEIFIHSLSLLKDLDWRAVCVGNPTENLSYYKELLQLSKQLQLHDRLKFVGQCDDMPAAYSLSDLVVSASTAEAEAFGRIAVEAQAMGRPVIATAHGGSLETVLPGKTGWLVEPGNIESLANAIREGLIDINLRKKYSKAGHIWVFENFDTVRMCENTISLYLSLMPQFNMNKIPL